MYRHHVGIQNPWCKQNTTTPQQKNKCSHQNICNRNTRGWDLDNRKDTWELPKAICKGDGNKSRNRKFDKDGMYVPRRLMMRGLTARRTLWGTLNGVLQKNSIQSADGTSATGGWPSKNM